MKSLLLLPVRNSRAYPWLLSLLSGLLLWLGWPTLPTALLLFIGFVPLLALEDHYSLGQSSKSGWKFFGFIFLALFIWNFGTTWWMYYSTAIGSIVAMTANTLLMTVPWLMFRLTKKHGGAAWGYLSWVLYWVTFEYIHLNWDLSWPWLTLGNGLAMFPQWIQWYEFTGVFGGTLWILVANWMIYYFYFRLPISGQNSLGNIKSVAYVLLWIYFPILISYGLWAGYEEQGKEVEIAVMQPNIDPYTEKFIGEDQFIPFEQQVDRFVALSQPVISPQTSFLVWPETAVDGGYMEQSILYPHTADSSQALLAKDFGAIRKILDFKKSHPQLSLLTGLTSYAVYQTKEGATHTARNNGKIFYDVFNTAYFLGDQGTLATYHKSKLVPGPESMPYPKIFGFLSDLMIDLGGTSGQLGKQQERTVFFNRQGIGIAPAICYESIYGDFMTRYIRNGAHFIFIITNDGWWRDSPGHKQHLHYATLRAIETRRCIARSANTGISTFINQKGELLKKTVFWEQAAINARLKANDQLTFYTRHGDYLARTAAWLSVLVFLSGAVKRRINK